MMWIRSAAEDDRSLGRAMFSVESEPHGGGLWMCRVAGTCDHRSLDRLVEEARALALVGADRIGLDLLGITSMDCGGAEAVVEFANRVSRLGIDVSVGAVDGPWARLLADAITRATDVGSREHAAQQAAT